MTYIWGETGEGAAGGGSLPFTLKGLSLSDAGSKIRRQMRLMLSSVTGSLRQIAYSSCLPLEKCHVPARWKAIWTCSSKNLT